MPTSPRLALAAFAGVAFLPGCASTGADHAAVNTAEAMHTQPPPLYEGMGSHRRKVSTANAAAQRYFDQGLVWTFSFNHDEAIRSFEHAAKLDPQLAMAWWGVAFCNGPHINNPVMDEARSRAAWDALQKANALASHASPAERALITALAARYADPAKPPIPMTFEERAPLDKAYADAMAKVYEANRDDADIAALYAESLMDCRPWDLWDPATREPRAETPHVLAALEHALALDPQHPGANHYYIHAVEASKQPERAVPAADRLRTLVPASGHMVHMPAHIDVRVGRWAQSAEQNRRATAADAAYRKISPRQGTYRIYMAHNDHFLTWACMMLGNKSDALAAARAMIANIPTDFVRDAAPFVDPMMSVELEALMRFGQWREILEVPAPPAHLPITNAYRHFARGSAFAALGQLDDAAREEQLFGKAVDAVPATARMAQNPAHTVLDLAEHVLAGEIAFRRGAIDDAVARLTKAVAIEDSLRYMEPPDWFQPVRHSLGAILVAADRHDEAEQVYRADLARWPENGWSLYGLTTCLEKRGAAEAKATRARFEKAWERADTELGSTCLCVATAPR